MTTQDPFASQLENWELMTIMDTEEAIAYCEENNIRGSYVECGVYWGGHPVMACNTILENSFTIRDIYMYDTYEGLPEPGEYDYTTDDAELWHMNREEVLQTWKSYQTLANSPAGDTQGWCYCSLEDVKKNVFETNYPKDKLHFIKGDVMETLTQEENIPDEISVLRLDTDWYESSKFELEKLYHKVTKGGVIILDDYFHWDGQRRATDEFLQENNLEKTIVKNNELTGYFIK